MTVFRKKMSIFTAKISDDLFLAIDQVFRIFSFFYQIFRIFTVLNVVYDPFLARKTPCLLFSYFPAQPTTLLLKIFGRRIHWPPPTSNFGGTVSPSPLGLHPCLYFRIVYSVLLLYIFSYLFPPLRCFSVVSGFLHYIVFLNRSMRAFTSRALRWCGGPRIV